MSLDGLTQMKHPSPARLSGIEASRGIAASFVVLYHVARHLDKGPGAPALRQILEFGHAGVDFFFVISGFIILFVHHRDIGTPAALGHYVWRRFTRLFPVYWAALALSMVLAEAGTHGAPPLTGLVWDASLLPSNHEMVLSVAWTLRFEVLFYCLFGLLILHRAAGIAGFSLWFLVSALAPLTGFTSVELPSQFFSAFNLEFLLGMAVAQAAVRWTIPHRFTIFASGLGLFALAAVLEDLGILPGDQDLARLFYGIPSALIVVSLAQGGDGIARRLPWVFTVVGSASYSIYLFHFMLIGPVWQAMLWLHLDRTLPVLIQFVMLSAMAIGGGVAVSIWVEYPLMARIRGRLPGRRLTPAQG